MELRGAAVGSLLVHGALVGAFAAGLFGAPPVRPPVTAITAEVPVEQALELDAVPIEVEAPPLAPLPAEPEPALPEPDEADPRLADTEEPVGPPAEIIGVSSIEGRRRGLPGIGGRAGRGRGPAPEAPAVLPPAPEPPPPDPVFLPPTLKEDRAPVYPPAARKRGVEGTVRVRVEVEADGSVRSTTVAVSSGDPALDAAALEAAAAWTFLPATEDGVPVASVVYRWVGFTLTGGR